LSTNARHGVADDDGAVATPRDSNALDESSTAAANATTHNNNKIKERFIVGVLGVLVNVKKVRALFETIKTKIG
jgi:hypothetical protein